MISASKHQWKRSPCLLTKSRKVLPIKCWWFCFGQGWVLFGWFSLLSLFCLFGKVGLTLQSQAFVYRIVIDYKMRSSMNDKPVLPKTGVGVKKEKRERKSREKAASDHIAPSGMLALEPCFTWPDCWHLHLVITVCNFFLTRTQNPFSHFALYPGRLTSDCISQFRCLLSS